jgi:hypothetical protein
VEVSVKPEYVDDFVVAGFFGHACEFVERHRGKKSAVVPLHDMRDSLKAWLGYHEVWGSKPRKKYSFDHISLTVFLGRDGEVFKAQVFRCEWPGIRPWTPQGISFQSPGAGQPHWQFDALKTLRDVAEDERTKSLANLEEKVAPTEFSPAGLAADLLEKVRQTAIERIHFASAAPWWLKQSKDALPSHMNAPEHPDELLRWVLACVSYIRQELKRC